MVEPLASLGERQLLRLGAIESRVRGCRRLGRDVRVHEFPRTEREGEQRLPEPVELRSIFPFQRKRANESPSLRPNRQILFGWTYEDDNGYGVLAKGWQGAFTLPREMFVKRWTVHDSRADERGSWGVVSRSSDSTTLETLGTRPAKEVDALMSESTSKWDEKSWTYTAGSNNSNSTWTAFSKQPKSRYYVLTATLDFTNASDAKAGFTIYKSPDASEQTHVFYDFAAETIRVDRSRSSVVTEFNLGTEAGKFRLWNVPASSGKTKLESLELKVFVDNSIVEVRT